MSAITRAICASIAERGRSFSKLYRTSQLVEQLGLPATPRRSLESLQTVATIRASLTKPIATIVDVGAHVGEFSEIAMRVLGADEAICFEPDVALHSSLRERLNGLNYRLFDCALDEVPSEETLRIREDASMNSLLSVDQAALAADFGNYDHRTVSAVRVKVSTLDCEWERLRGTPPLLLKLDTQGTELRILQGANHVLASTEAVLIEHMFTTPYVGAPRFADLMAFMTSVGFRCLAVTAVNRLQNHKISGVDLLFGR